MILRYRISLPNIKGFLRIYEIKSGSSLYTFAKQMRADMNFPQDQMVLFKAFGKDGAVSARYGMFDMGAGTIDSVTLEQTLKKGEESFVFFYDTTNAKSVLVNYDGPAEQRDGVVYPIVTEAKGPDPEEFENGYVAYEDLPDDKKKDPEDDDEEDDWDDDEDAGIEEDGDAEEVFDENE